MNVSEEEFSASFHVYDEGASGHGPQHMIEIGEANVPDSKVSSTF
jgi:hypothetical protein